MCGWDVVKFKTHTATICIHRSSINPTISYLYHIWNALALFLPQYSWLCVCFFSCALYAIIQWEYVNGYKLQTPHAISFKESTTTFTLILTEHFYLHLETWYTFFFCHLNRIPNRVDLRLQRQFRFTNMCWFFELSFALRCTHLRIHSNHSR